MENLDSFPVSLSNEPIYCEDCQQVIPKPVIWLAARKREKNTVCRSSKQGLHSAAPLGPCSVLSYPSVSQGMDIRPGPKPLFSKRVIYISSLQWYTETLLHFHRTKLCLVASQLCSRCVWEGKEPVKMDVRSRGHDSTRTPLLRREMCNAEDGTKNLKADSTKFKSPHWQVTVELCL